MPTERIEALRRLRTQLIEERREAALVAADIVAEAPSEGPDNDAQHRINSYLMIALDRHTMIGVLDAVIRDEESAHPSQPGMDKMAERYTEKEPKGVV